MSDRSLADLEQRITRLEDIHAIKQVQAAYMQLLASPRADEIANLFAQKTPGVTVEAGDSGVFEGIPGVKRMFDGLAQGHTTVVGFYVEHTAIDPFFTFSEDGNQAHVTWLSPAGIELVGSLGVAGWGWGKYECDYVKEDGRWRILHLHWYQTFETPMDKGPLHHSELPVCGTFRVPPIYPPDKPTTHFMPYSPFKMNVMLPEPPEDY